MDMHTTHYSSHVTLVFTRLYQASQSYEPSGQILSPTEPVASSTEL